MLLFLLPLLAVEIEAPERVVGAEAVQGSEMVGAGTVLNSGRMGFVMLDVSFCPECFDKCLNVRHLFDVRVGCAVAGAEDLFKSIPHGAKLGLGSMMGGLNVCKIPLNIRPRVQAHFSNIMHTACLKASWTEADHLFSQHRSEDFILLGGNND